MSAHTPGPWRVGINPCIVAETETDRWIAVCDEGYGLKKEQRIANAALIANAPALLALAQRVAKLPTHCEIAAGLAGLDALIAEARRLTGAPAGAELAPSDSHHFSTSTQPKSTP